VQRAKREREGTSWSSEEEEAFKQPIREQFSSFASMNNFASNLWIDNVLDPVETRVAMGLVLDLAARVALPESRFGVLRM